MQNKKCMRNICKRKKEEEKERWKIKLSEVNSEKAFWELVRKESRKRKEEMVDIKNGDWGKQ